MIREFFKNNKKKVSVSLFLCAGLIVSLIGQDGLVIKARDDSYSSEESLNAYVSSDVKEHEGGVFRGVVENGTIREVTSEEITADILDSGDEKGYVRSGKASVPGIPGVGFYAKADATPATDPYKISIADKLGEMMAEQLSNAYTNSAGTQASISSISTSVFANSSNKVLDINSSITFSFSSSLLTDGTTTISDSTGVLPYVEQAISRYPRLCCLFTLVSLYVTGATASLTVYSPVEASKLYSVTLQYENALDDILKVPNSNTNMSPVEKLLYLHDEVVSLTEYSYRSNLYAIDYVPAGTVIYNTSVCQSYAAVFNHLARRQGVVSYVLDSDTHAWNVVQVGGAWYYIDTTWDDSSVSGEDKINHYYFMVAKSAFSSGHELDDFYSSAFSGIDNSFGSAYDSYLPKVSSSGTTSNITSQMGYMGGYFYYAKDNVMYRWNGTGSAQAMTTVTEAANRRVNVCDGTVYISGADGLYSCNQTMTQASKLSVTSYTGMHEAAGVLYVSEGGSYYKYLDKSTSVVTPTVNPSVATATPTPTGSSASPGVTATPTVTPTPVIGIPTVPPQATATATATATVSPGATASTSTATPGPTGTSTSITAPGKTKITSITNIKTRAVKLKWKKVSATTRYRVQYSKSKSFTTKQYVDVLTNSVTIPNLYKNKTYYFRVRAVKIKRIDGKLTYAYGKWSAKKKIKIKK